MKFRTRILMRRNGFDLFERNRFQVVVVEDIRVPFLRRVHLFMFTLIRFTHPFYPSGTQPFFFRREGFPDSKSIYIQTVEIPLEDLFSGVAEKKLTLKYSFAERNKAAFLGRIGQRVALQSFSNKCSFYFERKTSR